MLCIGWIFKFFFFSVSYITMLKKNYDAHKTWWDIVKVACACVRGWLWVSFYLTALCNAPGSSEPRLCSRSSSCFRLNLYDQFHSYCHWSFFFFSLLLNSPSASSVVSLCTHSTCSTCTSNGAVDIFSLPPDVRTAQLSSVTSRMVTNHFHKCSYLRLWNAFDRALFTTQMFSHPLPA